MSIMFLEGNKIIMCGIIGTKLFDANLEIIKKFDLSLNNLRHRGPDQQDKQIFKLKKDYFVIGHNRSSIIDLSKDANQPMTCKNRRYTIVYNGEIYNYKELRKELEKKAIFLKQNQIQKFC